MVNASKSVESTNDAKLIGRTAWELMRTMSCPPEELRGIGLQMQKLENAGTTVGLGAIAEEQGKLTFKAIDKLKGQPDFVDQPGMGTSKIISESPILVGDSSSSPPKIMISDTHEARVTRSRVPVNYIDLSSSEEDSGAEDLKILSQAPAHLGDKASMVTKRQTLLNAAVVKRPKSVSVASKPLPILIPATSPAATTKLRLADPAMLTDKQLYLLGLDQSFFRSCSRRHQDDILRECLLSKGENNREIQDMLIMKGKGGGKGRAKKALYAPVFEQAAADKAKKEETAKRKKEKEERQKLGTVYYKLNTSNAPIPQFAGKSELEDIRNVLGDWMQGVGMDHAPALEEIEDFASYCLKSLSRDVRQNGGKGPDTAKIWEVLRWWKYLVEKRQSMNLSSGSQKLAADAWMDAWTDVRSRISHAVEIEWGAPIF